MTKNEVATTERRTLKSLMTDDAVKRQLAVALPRHMSADRMARVALTALLRVPKLAACTPESFMQCMLTCSQLGLEPDGRLAHLIPYGRDCTLIIDYKGLVALARRSGNVATVHADVVCENDDFDYDTGRITRHKIDFRRDRGNVYAVYATVKMKDGTEQCEVLSKAEVESVRRRSRAGNNGPWVTDWNEMAKKTAFRRLSKWLELSPEYRDAIAIDDDPKISGDAFTERGVTDETANLNSLLIPASQMDDAPPEPEPDDATPDPETSDTVSETSPERSEAFIKCWNKIRTAETQNGLSFAEQQVAELVEIGKLDADEAAELAAEIERRRE